MDWTDLKEKARGAISGLDEEYKKRLDTELHEIEKQGANDYWIDLCDEETKSENKNGLVLPWLLGITDIDPIKNKIDHIWEYQPDFPDIDIDFLPIARAPLKKYAADTYREEYICSVGNWITYKPKSAIQDACRALGGDMSQTIRTTTVLPDDFDNLTLADLARIKNNANLIIEDLLNSSNHALDATNVIANVVGDYLYTPALHKGSSNQQCTQLPLSTLSKGDVLAAGKQLILTGYEGCSRNGQS